MALTVLDASVVIGAADPQDPIHERCEQALRQRAPIRLALPASAYAEALVHPSRRGEQHVQAFDQLLDDLAITVVEVDRPIARRAAAIRSGPRAVRLPDALVLATGDVLDADEVITADRSWRRLSPRVVVA